MRRYVMAKSMLLCLATGHAAGPVAIALPASPGEGLPAARPFVPAFQLGLQAFHQQRYDEAERHFRQALVEQPDNVEYALLIANSRLSQLRGADPEGQAVDVIEPLVRQFPDNGELRAFFALALAAAQRHREAAEALEISRELGANPEQQLGRDVVERIQDLGRPSFVSRVSVVGAYFLAVYSVVILLMGMAGWLLSAASKDTPNSLPTIVHGHVVATGRESLFAKLYIFSLITGLTLFYVAVPIVSVGVILVTVGFIVLILMMPVVSVYLLTLVGFTGFGIAYCCLRSIFARPSKEPSPGLKRAAEDNPRLIQSVEDVASVMGTEYAGTVYVAVGSVLDLYQEGRGPFGMFGVQRRELTLGLAIVNCLTVGELKAVLAHEYAHFSNRDTVFGRFIHQATRSIEEAMVAMGASLGHWSYINPFYWFFCLYHKSYSMLAAGFLRSRDYLADRMAASVYGRTAFVSGLHKVATEGPFFEASLNHNVEVLVEQGKAFSNIYAACRRLRDETSEEEREQLYERILNEPPTLFASHPTIRQRFAAVQDMPDTEHSDQRPARELFENIEQLEQELTCSLTGSYSAFLEAPEQ